MVQTYVENNVVARLPQEYSEEALHQHFAEKIQVLQTELDEYRELRAELDLVNKGTDWTDDTPENSRSAQRLLAQYAVLDKEQRPIEEMYAQTQVYDNLLREYGNEFARLYWVKGNSEKRGDAEELSFVEVDITDNGDMLTQDQYFKMRADPEGRLRELALHVELGEEDEEEESSEAVGFNFGVMEFNQPNQPPQTKVQLSFDDDTLEKLDEAKLKKIFAFCESHGISVSDMEIRRFDGSLAEDLIREKIEKILEKAQKEKEERARENGIKEAAEQEERRKALDMELQNIRAAKGGIMPEGVSWDDVSTDAVPENRRMAATNNPYMAPLTREFLKAAPISARENAGIKTDYIETHEGLAQPQMLPNAGEITPNIGEIKPESDNNKIISTPDTSTTVQTLQPAVVGESISQKVQRIAKGIATAVLPKKKLQRVIDKPMVTAAENSGVADTVSAEVKTMADGTVMQNKQARQTVLNNTDAHPVRQAASAQASVFVPQNGQTQQAAASQQASAPTPPPPPNPDISMKKIEKGFEDWIENDIKKVKGLSYFKRHTGWFGHGWTEYIIYDNEDPDNRKKDGVKQKDGSVKYTYSFKLFLKQDKEGNLHFAYRTPNHRKLDEAMINDIVGKLKSLGYTHINFPSGVPNAEKALWRKAMGENGIVPIGMGLNRAKAEGMLKAAKEKLSTEAYAEYQYKLGLQMDRHNKQGGKTVDESEQIFIDGLINTHKYAAFTNAYTMVFKSKIKGLLREKNAETGAVDKTAAYRTLRKVFDVYKSALEHGGNLLSADGLTDKEKQSIRQLGLISPVEKLNLQQMDKLYDVLYGRQQKEAYNDIRDVLLKGQYDKNRGARVADRILIKAAFDEARESCESINDDLTALGIEELKIIKVANIPFDREFERYYTVDKPEYERTHPQPSKSVASAGKGVSKDLSDAENSDVEGEEAQEAKKRNQQKNANAPAFKEELIDAVSDDREISKSIIKAAQEVLQKAVEKSKGGKGI